MENDRKQVAICSTNDAFGGALRLLLDGYQVELASHPADDLFDTDVLVWDVGPGVSDRELIEVAVHVPTLVLAEQDRLINAVDAGCRGFLPRSAPLEEIRDAVVTIAGGGAVVPPDLLGTLLRHLVERRRHDEDRSEALSDLTERERQIFRLAAAGARKDEIAQRLYISPATARTHLQRVYRKMGVHSQAELMALAIRIGEFESEEES